MGKFTCTYSTGDERGCVSFDAKHDASYYKKYKMDLSDRVGCHYSISLKDLRYINWVDKTGFVRSRSEDLRALAHKRPRSRHLFQNPPGFDHTSWWRKPGDRLPLFCLTEPYHLNDAEIAGWEDVQDKFGLQYKIFPKSPKSLWVPNSTYMIFWWCPDYFDFDEHEKLLMSHEDANEFEKKCEVKKWTLK